MDRVFVTGLGVISPIGHGEKAFWEALMTGRSGHGPIARFDTSKLNRSVACEVKDFHAADFLSSAEARRSARCSQYAIAAARMAMGHAGLAPDAVDPSRLSVVFGTSMGDADALAEAHSRWLREAHIERAKLARSGTALVPIQVARAVGARGHVYGPPAACAAGTYAVALAVDLLRSGRADVVVAGSSEIIEPFEYAGFAALGAMAPDCARPFDAKRRGLVLGEGAAALVLESQRSAVARGATALAEVGGYGLACDAHHITRPHPDGEGSIAAVRDAIERSGLAPQDVDHVNAHGTGTWANDLTEGKVIEAVFGATPPPITSIKGVTGHCLGASSSLESVCCVLTLTHGRIPPTIHLQNTDCAFERLDIVAASPRAAAVNVVVNNSLAFGGYNAAVVFARPGRLPASAAAA